MEQIAVVGATGAQGGSVVDALLEDGYAVRTLTRRPDGDKAQALKERGVEVVFADLDDADSLTNAFDGTQGAFCVTNFWEHLSPERETQQGRNLAEAIGRAGIEHAIWSTLDDTRLKVPLDDDRIPTLLGKYKVPHCDSKADADHYFAESGVPTTYLVLPYYWENLMNPLSLQRDDDGTLTYPISMGDALLPGIAVADVGKIARAVFAGGTAFAGRRVSVAGEHLSGVQIAAALSEAFGESVRYVDLPLESLRAWGFMGEDGANTLLYKQLFNAEYCASRPVAATRDLVPDLLDFAGWLKQNGSAIPR